MKHIVILVLLLGLTTTTVFGQVKIGDNPQNIDASSVLELESDNKVLVITRVNNLTMESIIPLRGAILYNTDTQCLHYFNGTEWINLCDAVSFSLTNDPVVNARSTINIADNGGTINLEVALNSIRSENIVDGGINGNDIQNNSIGVDQLGGDSVGANELRDNSVGSGEIVDGTIRPVDIANSGPNQVLTTDATGLVNWVDASTVSGVATDGTTITGTGILGDELAVSDALQNTIADNTLGIEDNTAALVAHVAADLDTDNQNEVLTNVELDGNELVLTESGIERRVDLGVFNNTGTDSQTLDLIGNTLSISGGNNVDLEDYLDNTDAQELEINGNIISISGGNDITLPAGTEDTDEQDLTLAGTTLNITRGVGVDLSPVLEDATDGVITNVVINGTDLNFTGADGGFTGNVSLAGLGGGTADGVITDIQLTGTDLVVTGTTPGFSGTIPLGTLGGGTDTQQLTLEAGNLLTLTNDLTPIDLTPYLDNQNAGEVPVTATPANYISATPDVEAHLAGIDIALAAGGGNPTDEIQDLELTTDVLTITNNATATPIDLTPYLDDTDDQNAAEVIYDNTTSGLTGATAQAAIDELKTDIDNLTAGENLENTNLTQTNEDRTYSFGTNALTFIGTGTVGISQDPLFDAQQALHVDGNVLGNFGFATNAPLGFYFNGDTDTGVNFDEFTPDLVSLTAGNIRALTASNNGVTTNILIPESLELDGVLLDNLNAAGTPGQVLTTTGTGIEWQTVTGVGVAYDDTALLAATAANALAITTKEDAANKSIDGTLAANSDVNFPTEQAVKTYVDTQIGAVTAGDNISNADLILDAERTHDLAGFNLILEGTGNIGLGNFNGPGLPTGPADKLDVNGQIRTRRGFAANPGSAGEPSYGFYTDGDANTGMFRAGPDQIGLSAGGFEALRIEEDGDNTNIIVFESLQLDNLLLDKDGDSGTPGQILSSTGTQTDWINAPTGGGTVTTDGTLTGNGQVGNLLGIAIGAITGGTDGFIADGTITQADLADDSVNTVEIVNGAVTNEKIAPGADGEVLTTVAGATTWASPSPSGGIIAMAKIQDNGTTLKATLGVGSSGGGGTYNITLAPSLGLTDANYIINATILNPSADPKSIIISNQTTAGFTVRIINALAGGLIDSAFFFTITDL